MLAKFQNWTRANPLMFLALAAACGIIAAENGPHPLKFGWIAILATVFPASAILWSRASWLLLPGTVLAFAFIHEVRTDETFRHPLRVVLQNEDTPLTAEICGSLLPEFDTTDDKRAHALCTTLRVTLPALGKTIEQSAELLVRLPHGLPFPGAGIYEMSGSIYLPRTSSNPGTFDPLDHALRNGRVARFEVTRMRRVGDSGGEWWCGFLEAAEHCRRWISASLTLDLEDDSETSAVIRAMALGVSAEADDTIEDAFRNSGTLHVFAVSGLHVALLGVIVLVLLRQIGLRRGFSLWLMTGVVFAYAFITGWRPSAARAALMVAIFVGAPALDRESSLQNNLGAAALLLLGADTHQLFMPGFQLSFVVLWLSVIGSAPLLERLMLYTRLDPFLPPQLATWRQRLWSQVRRWLASTISVSTAAWIGSLPFILGHFQSVTPVAVIANCVLVPLSFFCLGATCLSLCAAALHLTGVQIILNNANWALAKAMIASAAWFASLPGGNFHFHLGACSDAPAVWRMLDLPHGGAANHLRVGGTHWLFDTGDQAAFRRVLRPYLHGQGVDSLSGVFLSHNDADHVGAVGEVQKVFGMPRLFCSTQEPGKLDSSLSALRRLAETTVMQKLRVDQTVELSGDSAFKVTAQVLHPAAVVESARGDDRALVLKLHLGPWRVLWMSDAGWSTEKKLLNGTTSLRCDILIRSQHETDRDVSGEFLLKASPRVILCGSDARDSGTALPRTLVDFARKHQTPLFDTWKDGSIELRFQQHELHVIPTHGVNSAMMLPR